MRTEHDTMGSVQVPDDAYYGAQTQRAVENFPISGKTMPPELIHALGLVKWACAKANAELGMFDRQHSCRLSEEQIEALLTACLEVAEGKFDDQFPVDVYQTGSGTSTNMNANEVIARRANEIAEARRQTAEGNGQTLNTFNQGTNNVGVSGLKGLAEGDGFDSRNLPVGEKIAEGGDICSVRPDAESSGVHSGEHSGGQRQEFQQRIHPVSAHSERVEVGIGNTPSDKHQSGLSDRDGHSVGNGNEQGNRQHVDCVDKSPVLLKQSAAVCRLPSAVSSPIHPNDHVNLGQSSNDIFPTAIHVAVGELIREKLMPAIVKAGQVIDEKVTAWENVLKIGRTHLADATPMTLGQEFGGFAGKIGVLFAHASYAKSVLENLPVGGTAIGTGINTHVAFGKKVAKYVSQYLGQECSYEDDEFEEVIPRYYAQSTNLFASNAQRDELIMSHALIKTIAVTLFNIANNIRWLGSGPRAGFYEVIIPDLQPGSSIMPGKVNPVLCEALMQACARVIGNDQTMTFCGAAGGQFQLNVMMPVMADTAIESVKILSGALEVFTEKCLKGLEANEEKCREGVEKSLSMATALNPYIGYEKAAEIAKEAFKTDKTVREVCLEWNVLPPEQLAEVLDPWKMIAPR